MSSARYTKSSERKQTKAFYCQEALSEDNHSSKRASDSVLVQLFVVYMFHTQIKWYSVILLRLVEAFFQILLFQVNYWWCRCIFLFHIVFFMLSEKDKPATYLHFHVLLDNFLFLSLFFLKVPITELIYQSFSEVNVFVGQTESEKKKSHQIYIHLLLFFVLILRNANQL